VGLKYFEDLRLKIPRDEVTEMVMEVKKAVLKVFPYKKLEITACGSYRRGKSECGDADILITTSLNHPQG
jgi:DNA polymerase lambda